MSPAQRLHLALLGMTVEERASALLEACRLVRDAGLGGGWQGGRSWVTLVVEWRKRLLEGRGGKQA
jgi:hypothetical protein